MAELNIIAAITVELIQLLKPDQIRQIKKEIEELEKEQGERRQEFLKAVESNDTDELHRLIGKHL